MGRGHCREGGGLVGADSASVININIVGFYVDVEGSFRRVWILILDCVRVIRGAATWLKFKTTGLLFFCAQLFIVHLKLCLTSRSHFPVRQLCRYWAVLFPGFCGDCHCSCKHFFFFFLSARQTSVSATKKRIIAFIMWPDHSLQLHSIKILKLWVLWGENASKLSSGLQALSLQVVSGQTTVTIWNNKTLFLWAGTNSAALHEEVNDFQCTLCFRHWVAPLHHQWHVYMATVWQLSEASVHSKTTVCNS